MFDRYIGIDYSGADIPIRGLPAIRVYQAKPKIKPTEVFTPLGGRSKYWSRKGLAEWLVEILKNEPLSIIGIDHGFSFPHIYFETFEVPTNWPKFLDDFCAHWPTDQDQVWVRDVKDGQVGKGKERPGEPTWRRITEIRCGAGSVFHFNVPGVAKATHAGIPWLRFIRHKLGDNVHFWPFDGWNILAGKSVLVEAYPALYSRNYDKENRKQDQHDAYSVAAWMRDADLNGSLKKYFNPSDLRSEEKKIASFEGWILGVDFKNPSKD